MSESIALPSTMKALVVPAKGEAFRVQEIPTPQPVPGSAVIKVLAASLDGSLEFNLSAKGFFTFPEPFVPGTRCVGRIAAVGPDTTSLPEGQLVIIDSFIRGRDNSNIQALFGLFDGPTPQGKAWFAENWRNGTYAQFVNVPLENVHPLNEQLLCNTYNYSFAELNYISIQVVAYGGFRGINLQAGETVIIAPATGGFTGSAVGVAIAMGARVIAASRNLTALQKIQSHFPKGRVEIVQITNDVEKDTAALKSFGPVDAYIDISPAVAEKSTHVRSCFNALRQYGRASLMGVLQQDIAISYMAAVFKNLTIRAQYMYERSDFQALIKLAESGVLKLGKDIGCEIMGEFPLEEMKAANENAQKNESYGQLTILTPNA